SPTTLRAFIGALELNEDDQERLYRIHEDREAMGNPLPRPVPLPSGLNVPTAEHQTLTLREYHHVGPDGIPVYHETIQSLRCVVDRMVSYPYRFDTNEVRDVRVIHGGTAGELYPVEDTVYAVDIALDRALALAEAT